jgi:polyisoprenoid-binding protein YceI
MKRPAFLFVFAIAILGLTAARADTYRIDSARSSIAFGVHQFLGLTKGKFTQFSGTISVDGEHPEQSSVSVQIPVRSIDTNIRKRDEHLLSPEFFDVSKYPQITFRSRAVQRTGADSGDVTGDLSMHGVTRSVTLHIKLLTAASDGQLPARTRWWVSTDPLKRKDFNLLFSSTAETVSGISQEVSPSITIEAVREK